MPVHQRRRPTTTVLWALRTTMVVGTPSHAAPASPSATTAGSGSAVAEDPGAIGQPAAQAAGHTGAGVFEGGFASDADILTALDDIALDGPARNIRAVNLSFGDSSHHVADCTGSVYSGVFLNLRAPGILPVVSAGNPAYGGAGDDLPGLAEPARASGAISVGASYAQNNAGFLTAPGRSSPAPAPRSRCGETRCGALTLLRRRRRRRLLRSPPRVDPSPWHRPGCSTRHLRVLPVRPPTD